MVDMTLGEMIRHYRRRAGLTQEELAERAELSPRGLIYLERGERHPQPGTARRLADALSLAGEEREAFLAAGEPGDGVTVSPARVGALPAQPTPFIGREDELGRALAVVSRPDVRLLTLTGAGGTGKTRLAVEIASQVIDHFPDGAHFVALAPVSDADLVLSTVAQTLGVRETPNQPVLATLRAYLQDKQTLLVLDNFEQVLSAAAGLPALLAACPGVRMLVTSRFVLRVSGEHEFLVPPLQLPETRAAPSAGLAVRYDAIQLFVQRARMVRPDFALTDDNARAVVEICRALDGLPLAIELAAARIKVLPPERLLARMSDRLRLLTGGNRDLPARQQTLRDTIAWSHDLLDEGEQVLFRRLAVFVGGCSLEAVEVVCGGDLTIDALDGLASLVDKNLVRQDEAADMDGEPEPRFSMLETIREYAAERAVASGEVEALRRRHAEYFRKLSARLFPKIMSADRDPALAVVTRERDNIRAAIRWAIENGEPEIGMETAGPLSLWYLGVAPAEGLQLGRELLALPGAEKRTAARIWGLAVHGYGGWGVGQVDIARACAAEATEIAREVGDDELLVNTLLARGSTTLDASAVEYSREAREIARRHGWKFYFAYSSWTPAFTLPYHGDVATVSAWLEEALAVGRETGDTWVQAVVLMLQGFLAIAGGQLEVAGALLTESARLYRLGWDKLNRAGVLVALGAVSLLTGQVETAAQVLQEGLELSRELNDPGNIAACMEGLAGVTLAQGDPLRAARMLGAARSIRDATGAVPLPTSDALSARIANEVRAALDGETFARAYAEGLAVRGEEAVAYTTVTTG